ncbi:probable oxidoreductase (short-chain dehydrogenase family) [Natronomonas pharaonis DSM 2160]|uniref:Probable oxidoreductase (Short-chain dehydrogenase family) n=1 Tax=Natronomonas pharaonis (strain ATCC 35678 / DSM 2160 / CIP 103997 / JCM 8858 / NBRC 14720 / NCIMB 2260 / Gabara) TaxID=348780 RepID=A0A1U7EUL4_NATPD|nr:SDR family oxidoreductase [Natronomonas pharaonis]CAI48671.1 probable oxidoreductase (short-chain dehydrogenase family) [Natronomonas pharaonis DSM 2160]
MSTRTVLITGCSSGIGRAAAYAFLENEWRVYATARNPADIQTLGEAGCDIGTINVRSTEDVERVVDRVIDEAGRIDALVNNAGYGQHGPIEDINDELFEKQFDVNVFGPHRLVRAVLPHMRERRDGTIINVSSVAGRLAAPGMGVYSASKHAIEGYSDSLRRELEPFDIDVSVVQPGPVETSFRDRVDDELGRLDRTDAYEDLYAFQEDASLFGGDSPVASHPGEVADVILEAASSTDPQPRYVVGTAAQLLVYASYLPDPIADSVFDAIRRFVS